MREQIDEFIWTILSFGRECSDEWWANQKSSGRPFLDHRRRYLYSLLKEEIEKVRGNNPYPKAKLASAEYYEGEGFDRACQRILALLRSVDKEV